MQYYMAYVLGENCAENTGLLMLFAMKEVHMFAL